MKIIINDDKIIVFLNDKQYIKYNDEVENFFKSLLSKLEEKFDIDINNYNDVCVYTDCNYGMILELKCDDLDYFFDSTEISIFKKNNFLYEIDYSYINKDILNECIMYKIKDKLYLKIEKEIDETIFSKILEYSDIIYGEKAEKIEKLGKKVNYEKTSCGIGW